MALGPLNLKRRIELVVSQTTSLYDFTRLYGPMVAWKKSFVKYTADFCWFVLCPAWCICSIGNQCSRHSTPPISEQTASRPASFWPATPVRVPGGLRRRHLHLPWCNPIPDLAEAKICRKHSYFAKTISFKHKWPIMAPYYTVN